MVYPALLQLMAHTSAASSRLNWRPPTDLNGLVRFAERRNLVSARVPSHFNWPVHRSLQNCGFSVWNLFQPVSCPVSGAENFKVAPRFLEKTSMIQDVSEAPRSVPFVCRPRNTSLMFCIRPSSSISLSLLLSKLYLDEMIKPRRSCGQSMYCSGLRPVTNISSEVLQVEPVSPVPVAQHIPCLWFQNVSCFPECKQNVVYLRS